MSRFRLWSHGRRSILYLLSAALSCPVSVLAQELDGSGALDEQGFVLHAGSCPPELTLDLERLVRIELRGAKGENRPALEIDVRCDESTVTVGVTGADGARAGRYRRIDLSRTAPSVHARVLALAISELIREHDAQPRRRKPPPRPAPQPKPKPPTPAPPPEARPPVGELEAFFALSQFDFSNELGPGAGLRFWYMRLAPWHLALDFSAGTSARDVELGRARLVSGSLGVRFGYTLRMGDWALRFGAGQRTGMARVSGTAADSSSAVAGSVLGAFTTSLGFLALDTALGGPVRAGLGAELGKVLLPVRGQIQNDDDFGVDGTWAALEIRISLGL